MSDIIITILSSTLFASVFSSIISYIINKKNISLQYITNERKEWRVSMRELAVKIYNADVYNIGIELVKLKVRINAYGRSFQRIESDTHIWRIIEKLEDQNQDINDFKHNKARLIDYISILLKFDWERSKDEIIGSKKLIYRILLYVATVGLFIYMYFYVWLLPLSPNVFIIIYAFTGYCFITPDYDFFKYIKILKGSSDLKNNRHRNWVQYSITLLIVTIFAVCSLVSTYYSIRYRSNIVDFEFMSIIIMVMFGIVINFLEGKRKLELYTNYIESVHDLLISDK